MAKEPVIFSKFKCSELTPQALDAHHTAKLNCVYHNLTRALFQFVHDLLAILNPPLVEPFWLTYLARGRGQGGGSGCHPPL